MIHENLYKYIYLVGGLVGRELSDKSVIVTLDSVSYHGLHTRFHFNTRIAVGFDTVNYKMSFKLNDLTKVVTKYTPAYYALKNLQIQEVLKYAH